MSNLDPGSSVAKMAKKHGDRTGDYIKKLGSDYRFFIKELWREKGLDRKSAPPGEIELDMADFGANGPRLRGVLGFRGKGKSHFVTGALPLYRWLRDRNRKVFVCSKSDDQATETGQFVKGSLESVWFLRHLAPQQGQRNSVEAFDIAGTPKGERQPSWSIAGITGSLEGNRGHTVIPDDCETKTNSTTVEARLKLRRLFNEFNNFLYPDKPHSEGGPVDPTELVVVGTPKHEQTVYLHLIDCGFVFQSYPIMFPGPQYRVIALAPIIAQMLADGRAQPGDPTVPTRFGHTEIARCQKGGRTEFEMEFMLVADLAARTLYPLRLQDLIVMDVHRDHAPVSVAWGLRDHNGSTAIQDIPCLGFDGDQLYYPVFIDKDRSPYTGTKMWIDPAGRGNDKTGIAIIGHLAGLLYCKHWGEYEGGSSTEALAAHAALARQHDARDVYIETNADITGAYRQLLEVAIRREFRPSCEDHPEGWSASIIDDTKLTHATGVKEIRICQSLEPVTSTHRLIVDRSVAANQAFQHQFTRIRKERNCFGKSPDGLDALAGCVRAWTYALNTDPTIAQERARARTTTELELKKIRRKMLERLGMAPAKPRWFRH